MYRPERFLLAGCLSRTGSFARIRTCQSSSCNHLIAVLDDLFGFSLGGGVARMVALQAPELAALTLSDPRNFLFFPRTPDGKRAAKDYFARLKERAKDRDRGDKS